MCCSAKPSTRSPGEGARGQGGWARELCRCRLMIDLPRCLGMRVNFPVQTAWQGIGKRSPGLNWEPKGFMGEFSGVTAHVIMMGLLALRREPPKVFEAIDFQLGQGYLRVLESLIVNHHRGNLCRFR